MTALLYLFNSGSRGVYVKNVLNTLYLPAGAHNQHRWQPKHIDVAGPVEEIAPGTECMVVYACLRENEPPLYVPLRRVTLERHPETVNGKVYFHVLEGDYICPKDPSAFQDALGVVLEEHRPPAQAMDDNHYVIEADGVDPDSLLVGPDAWLETVKTLSSLPAFQGGTNPVVFLQAELTSGGDRLDAQGANDSAPGRFRVKVGQRCQIRLTYRVSTPDSATDDAEVTLDAILGDVNWSGGRAVAIDGSEDSRWIEFTMRSPGARSFRVLPSKGEPLLPTESIDFVVARSRMYPFEVAAWFVLYGTVLLLGRRGGVPYWLQMVALPSQPLFVLWALRLFGKSPV